MAGLPPGRMVMISTWQASAITGTHVPRTRIEARRLRRPPVNGTLMRHSSAKTMRIMPPARSLARRWRR
jgi:hypothetical protein